MQIAGQVILTNTTSGAAYTPASSANLTIFAVNNSVFLKDVNGTVTAVGTGTGTVATSANVVGGNSISVSANGSNNVVAVTGAFTHVWMDSGQQANNTTPIMKFNQITQNDYNCYDSSTGIYSVKIDGYYLVHSVGMLDAITTEQIAMRIYKGSTEQHAVWQTANQSSNLYSLEASTIIKCVSGDQLTVRHYCSATKTSYGTLPTYNCKFLKVG